MNEDEPQPAGNGRLASQVRQQGYTFNYNTIKQFATELHMKVEDLLAMTIDNDPFYIMPEDLAQPATLTWARWIRDLWPRLHFTRPVHDRRINYALWSLGDVVMPEGTKFAGLPYDHEHHDIGWGYLQTAVKNARYLHYIPYRMIEDQRNPAAENAVHYAPPDPSIAVAGQAADDFLMLPGFPSSPRYLVQNYAHPEDEFSYADERQIANQRYHLEVWAEKTTMNDVLLPWCRTHGAVFVTAQGQMTMTGAWEAAERIRKHGKPAVIFYISDFDLSGQSMPLAIARKIERFLRVEYANQDPPRVLVQVVALTYDQVKQYNIPDMPTDNARWKTRYGIGTAELDALEVYHPGELRRLLDAAAAPYWDADLHNRIDKAERSLRHDLGEVRERILNTRSEQLSALEDRWNEAVEQARDLFTPIWEEIQAEHQAIVDELKQQAPKLEDYPLPTAVEADPALADGALFDSDRRYMDQITEYTRYKHEHVVQKE